MSVSSYICKVYTYTNDEDSVHARARGFGYAVDGGRERYLLHLAADVEAEARDDDRGDVDPARAGLYSLEDELEERRDERRVPGNEAVDETADERAHRDAEHAYEAEQTNVEPGFMMSASMERYKKYVKERAAYVE